MAASRISSGRAVTIVRWLHRDPRFRVGDWLCDGTDTGPGQVETNRRAVLAFARRGVYRRQLGRRSRIVDPGSVVFYPADCEFAVRHPAAGPDRSLIVETSAETLETLGRGALAEDPATLPTRAALVLRRIEEAARAKAALLVEELLLDLTRAVLQPRERSAAPRPGTRAARRRAVERAREVMAVRSGERLTLDVIAREAAYSPYHMSEVFRQHTGWTLHRWLTRIRVLNALDALETPVSLTRIAYDAGFSSPSHFAAVFRRELGHAPSRLRAALLEGAHRR